MKILEKTDTFDQRLECFRRFVVEREHIRLRKEIGDPRPWTKDPILDTYHFCNVCRADDRVTIWIGEWAKEWDYRERWFAYAVARWFNEPKTLDALPTKWDPKAYKHILKKMIDNGQKVFRASYIINGFPDMPKYVSVVDKVLQPLWKSQGGCMYTESMENSHKLLMDYPGMGSFMAGQIVADWETFDEIDGQDKYTWAPLGPGSARGICWLYGIPKVKQDEACEFMRQTYKYMMKHEPKLTKRLILHDIQNCFCEMSKYCRGYSKTKYKPFEEGFL